MGWLKCFWLYCTNEDNRNICKKLQNESISEASIPEQFYLVLQSFIFVLVAPTGLDLPLQTLVLGFELDEVLPRELRTPVQLLRKLGLEGIELLLLLGEAVAQLSAFNIHSKLRKIIRQKYLAIAV